MIREPQWINGEQPFNDPQRAEQLAKAMLDDGIDIIYAMASASNRGAFRAVSGDSKARIIGNAINQCPLAPGKVLDNIEVSMDTAIVLAVGEAMKGALAARIDYGMKEGAVSLTSLERDIAFF
ncbi:BMP family ABC transporter substrate-binding protein [Undibacterium arcticum]